MPCAAAGALEIVLKIVLMIISIDQPDARDHAGIQRGHAVAALAEHLNAVVFADRRGADDDRYGVFSRGSDERLEDVLEFSWRIPGFCRV
jgi:hypothetical protein